MSIEFLNECGFDGVSEEALIDVAGFALRRMDVHPEAELTITCVDLATIADLHESWMNLAGPTDVMSFPMDELVPGGRPDVKNPGPAMLGDIVLCPEFAQRQAAKAGHGLTHELCLLTVHGCLHLLGYDHANAREEQQMFALQNDILKAWYLDTEKRGCSFAVLPTSPQAFPTAAEREELDRQMEADGHIPAIGEPSEHE